MVGLGYIRSRTQLGNLPTEMEGVRDSFLTIDVVNVEIVSSGVGVSWDRVALERRLFFLGDFPLRDDQRDERCVVVV